MSDSLQPLQDKVALVTGGSRGIGRAIALALADAGAAVAVNYRIRQTEAADVCAQIADRGGRSLSLRADVAVADEVTEMVGQSFLRTFSWRNRLTFHTTSRG